MFAWNSQHNCSYVIKSLKTKIVTVGLTLFLVFTFFCCSSQKTGWKGTIEEVDGVTVIMNPAESLYGEIELDLEEDLRIGSEEDENCLFYAVKDVAVDNQENIYVADMNNHRIQKFDQEGKYLQTIGRMGQGPGEFEQPLQLEVDDNKERIYVLDGVLTIEILNTDGIHLNSFTIPNVIDHFILNNDGSIMAVLHRLSKDTREYTQRLCKIDSNGEITDVFAESPYNAFVDGPLIVYTGYEVRLHLAGIDRETCVYGYSKEYELCILDREGKLLKKIKKNEPIPKFTPEEKSKRIFIKHPIPKYKPYYFSILVDSAGRIYVQRNYDDYGIPGYGSVEKLNEKVDVFSKEGYFLFETTLPPNTFVIRNEYLYSYEVDEDEGTECIIRYKIKNWDQIKIGIN